MTTFKPTHLLTITVGTRTERTPVAVVDADWEPCEPEAGAQLVTAEEWAAEGSVSYTLDDGGALCCNGSATGWGNGSWELVDLADYSGEIALADGVEAMIRNGAPRSVRFDADVLEPTNVPEILGPSEETIAAALAALRVSFGFDGELTHWRAEDNGDAIGMLSAR